MAESHADRQHRVEWFESLITGGKPGEQVLAVWRHGGVDVASDLPSARTCSAFCISIGGGRDLPLPLVYCRVRGDVGKAIQLLEESIAALKADPN